MRKMWKYINSLVLGALLLAAQFSLNSCKEKEPAVQAPRAPRLISIVPSIGYSGCTAIISGLDFSEKAEENKVTMGDAVIPVLTASKNRLVLTMPSHADGDVEIAVSVNGKAAESTLGFTYAVLPEKELKVVSLSPASAAPGTEITIFGENFSVIKEENKVSFGGNAATVVSASETMLKVIAPEHERGQVEVKVEVDNIFTITLFTYKGLFFASNSPTSGSKGIDVTIVGECFSTEPSENTVTINGVPATVKSATESTLVVTMPSNPEGTYDFTVKVGDKTVTGGTYTYSKNWYVETVLGSFADNSGRDTKTGTGSEAMLWYPQDLAPGKDGSYWITVRNGAHGIYRMSPEHTLTKLVTSAENSLLNNSFPWEGSVDSQGLYYFCSKNLGKLFTCTADGTLAEYPVMSEGTAVQIPNPMRVLVGKADTLYLLSRGSGAGTGKILKIKDNAVHETYPITSGLCEHIAFNYDKTKIFAIGNNTWDILLLDLSDGTFTKIAGKGAAPTAAAYTDGTPGDPFSATIGGSEGAVCAPDGTLYFGDYTSKTLRKFTPDATGDYTKGTITTIAGKAFTSKPKDGIGTDAVFEYPAAITFAADWQTLYLLDGTQHGTVRKIYYAE